MKLLSERMTDALTDIVDKPVPVHVLPACTTAALIARDVVRVRVNAKGVFLAITPRGKDLYHYVSLAHLRPYKDTLKDAMGAKYPKGRRRRQTRKRMTGGHR